MNTDKIEWLKSEPNPEDLTSINGIIVMLNHVVEEKLDELTDHSWSTKNYQSKFININGRDYISASLELNVSFFSNIEEGGGYYTRTLVGAVTFPLDHFPDNQHWDNTAKTLCITNAASDLGRQFGRYFNKVEPVILDRKAEKINKRVKLKPSVAILNEYTMAIIGKNQDKIKQLTEIYDIATPNEEGDKNAS